MKREARQRRIIRTSRVRSPKSETQSVQRLDSPPAAGLFSNVPAKPSNDSKFTGKCGRPQCLECHLNPGRKSKTKGSQKLWRSNMDVNLVLITWKAMDRRAGLNFSGFSATGILDHLYIVNDQDDEIDDHINDGDDDCVDGGPLGLVDEDEDDDDDDFMANFWSLHENDAKIDDAMSFCDVGFVLDQTEEDEG